MPTAMRINRIITVIRMSSNMTEGSERYWEGRWRDADKEIRRLQLLLAQLQKDFAQINGKLDAIANELQKVGF